VSTVLTRPASRQLSRPAPALPQPSRNLIRLNWAIEQLTLALAQLDSDELCAAMWEHAASINGNLIADAWGNLEARGLRRPMPRELMRRILGGVSVADDGTETRI